MNKNTIENQGIGYNSIDQEHQENTIAEQNKMKYRIGPKLNTKTIGFNSEGALHEIKANRLSKDSMEHQVSINFSSYRKIPIIVERGSFPPPIITFEQSGLHPTMKRNMASLHYQIPTPVQAYAIPIVLSGIDLMTFPQTGSGKISAFITSTFSFLFDKEIELAKSRPAPHQLKDFKAEPRVLIIAPTREICLKIFSKCIRFCYKSILRSCVTYGGADIFYQLRQLERGCDILVASPGCLLEFLEKRKIGLSHINHLILYKVDCMIDMRLESTIRDIILKNGISQDRQTLIFSATLPHTIHKLFRDLLKPNYLILDVGYIGGTTSSVKQNILFVKEENKREKVDDLLKHQSPRRTLILVETRRGADSLDQYLYEHSYPSTSIHGERSYIEREDALSAFNSGICPIMVATAAAVRGIDIKNVVHVINYDMPNDMNEYIHRIGRTARVGKVSLVTSFYNERSSRLAPTITRLLIKCQQDIPYFLQKYMDVQITREDLTGEDIIGPPGKVKNEKWIYSSCSNNYLSKHTRYLECQTSKDETRNAVTESNEKRDHSRPLDKLGEWLCPDCIFKNFSRRMHCFICHVARPDKAKKEMNEDQDRKMI
ncbi:P-loop containing nucleoside triphosphate hydrolase protein, partial [Spinellus fusiger]